MKMGNLPRFSLTLRLWKKLKHTLPGRKLLGLECCMPELRLSESARFLLVYTASPRGGIVNVAPRGPCRSRAEITRPLT